MFILIYDIDIVIVMLGYYRGYRSRDLINNLFFVIELVFDVYGIWIWVVWLGVGVESGYGIGSGDVGKRVRGLEVGEDFIGRDGECGWRWGM